MSLSTFAAAQLLRALPRVQISRAVGRLCEQPLPRRVAGPLLRVYSRAYKVDLSEAAAPPGGYPTFDAFFTRMLREGARRIDDDPVVSPADGLLSASGVVDPGTRLWVKGQPYEVGELTGDSADAERYRGGDFAVVYLAPGDYHRVHSPVDGVVRAVRGIAGDLFPVNKIGERHFPGLFVRNSRAAIAIDSDAHGRVMVVMVGAVIVGRITVTGLDAPNVPVGLRPFEPPRRVERGSELGVFHLGSTVVVLLEPGVRLDRPLGKIRYGESLLRAA
ncbi:MAG TPA: archaetidylserine decarboxylase [Polyangiaceae bacterium]|nr:archaetidylserine decarboxylase [Polyangiaceae bacterium]